MKALTIHTPWAWAIVHGHKRVENRSWATSYRGPLAIHAGLSRASDEIAREALDAVGVVLPALETIRGLVLGQVELVDCSPAGEIDDPLAGGPWCWILRDARVYSEPFAVRGRLGLFDLTR